MSLSPAAGRLSRQHPPVTHRAPVANVPAAGVPATGVHGCRGDARGGEGGRRKGPLLERQPVRPGQVQIDRPSAGQPFGQLEHFGCPGRPGLRTNVRYAHRGGGDRLKRVPRCHLRRRVVCHRSRHGRPMGRDRGHEDQRPPEGAVHGGQDQRMQGSAPPDSTPSWSLFPGSRTLTLSGAINTVQGATLSRFESYRFVDKETMASIVGIQSNKAIGAWYSPYTDFPPNWRPMWAGGYARRYSSPTTSERAEAQDSPIPVLGASNGRYVRRGERRNLGLPGAGVQHAASGNQREPARRASDGHASQPGGVASGQQLGGGRPCSSGPARRCTRWSSLVR